MRVIKALPVMLAAILLALLMWPIEIILGLVDIVLYPFMTAADFFRTMTEDE